jgi:hypothetical protein
VGKYQLVKHLVCPQFFAGINAPGKPLYRINFFTASPHPLPRKNS